MAKHPAAEAPRMTTDYDGTRRIETEEERIKRVTTTTRIQASMERIEAAAERDAASIAKGIRETEPYSDYRPGDLVSVITSEITSEAAEVIGRDGKDRIIVRYHTDGTIEHAVPAAHVTMLTPGNGHPSREQAAMNFADSIITHRPGALIFSKTPAGRQAQVRPPEAPSEAQLAIRIKRLTETATIPTQARHGDAGYDLHADEDAVIYRGGRGLISTGLAVAIPVGYVGLIMPRSGLAHKQGIDILGGVIDAGYRGEVKVILQNHGGAGSFHIQHGDRIAQLVIQPVRSVYWDDTDTLPDSERAAGGFGSTGA